MKPVGTGEQASLRGGQADDGVEQRAELVVGQVAPKSFVLQEPLRRALHVDASRWLGPGDAKPS